jgi:uncharacterized protein YndB with AHSA1/START domain
MADIISDQDAVVVEIFIAAPPERVFQALVHREQALQWGSNPEFQVIEWNLDPRPGGRWASISVEAGKPGRYEHHGEVLEFVSPRLLVHTWFANWHSDPSLKTIVRYELTSVTGGTQLKVVHSGLAQLPAARKGYSQGWPGLVERIKRFVEAKS